MYILFIHEFANQLKIGSRKIRDILILIFSQLIANGPVSKISLFISGSMIVKVHKKETRCPETALGTQRVQKIKRGGGVLESLDVLTIWKQFASVKYVKF